MNLKNLSTEELKAIIDNAPEWAVWYAGFIYRGVYYLGKVSENRPVQLFTKHSGMTLSPVDHYWNENIDSGEVVALIDIKSELQSRLEIDSTQAETLVTISNLRTWEGSPEQFSKHRETIIHWCSGWDVECWNCDNWYKDVEPSFAVDEEFRVKKPTPKTGEVWSSDYADVVISESGYGISFTGQVIDISEDFHKVADNVKEYLRK